MLKFDNLPTNGNLSHNSKELLEGEDKVWTFDNSMGAFCLLECTIYSLRSSID